MLPSQSCTGTRSYKFILDICALEFLICSSPALTHVEDYFSFAPNGYSELGQSSGNLHILDRRGLALPGESSDICIAPLSILEEYSHTAIF